MDGPCRRSQVTYRRRRAPSKVCGWVNYETGAPSKRGAKKQIFGNTRHSSANESDPTPVLLPRFSAGPDGLQGRRFGVRGTLGRVDTLSKRQDGWVVSGWSSRFSVVVDDGQILVREIGSRSAGREARANRRGGGNSRPNQQRQRRYTDWRRGTDSHPQVKSEYDDSAGCRPCGRGEREDRVVWGKEGDDGGPEVKSSADH